MSTPQPQPDDGTVQHLYDGAPVHRVAFARSLAAALTRRTVSGSCVAVAVPAATAGAWLLWGLGWALIALAGMLLGLGVLLGWE